MLLHVRYCIVTNIGDIFSTAKKKTVTQIICQVSCTYNIHTHIHLKFLTPAQQINNFYLILYAKKKCLVLFFIIN